ncbi:ACP S-malonyltransferase [Eubacterium sp.]|uniref:ACP S-malonyltransferase n=1 Tax=Eubacterium sp. TaxID=142586 RepID=UPI00351FCA9C
MDGKIAVIFSGQGAQYTGMGKELCERYSESNAIFEYASSVLGKDMKELCFNGSQRELSKTINTQVAMFTMEAASYAVLKKYGIKPDVVAGFSFGEYGAYYASGIFDLMTSLYLVNQRAIAMNKVENEDLYGMGAISGDSIEKIEKICSYYDNAWIANYNSHSQVTITGSKSEVIKILEEAEKINYRATLLNLSGPFHSKYMYDAAQEFAESTKLIRKSEGNIPIILNVTGDYYKEGDVLEEIMVKQIYSPVLWSKTVEKMLDDGVTCFIEIGPGRVLSKFVANIKGERNVDILSLEDMESLSNVVDRIYR